MMKGLTLIGCDAGDLFRVLVICFAYYPDPSPCLSSHPYPYPYLYPYPVLYPSPYPSSHLSPCVFPCLYPYHDSALSLYL